MHRVADKLQCLTVFCKPALGFATLDTYLFPDELIQFKELANIILVMSKPCC